MRVAIFANATGKPSYPGGRSDWKGSEPFTLVGHGSLPDGEYIIGRYFGDKTEGELPSHSDQTWPPKKYRTQVAAEEFIGLFTNDQWGDVVLSVDPDVIAFRTRLQNYKKTFDAGHTLITDGMTKIVQDGIMNAAAAQEIIKGVVL